MLIDRVEGTGWPVLVHSVRTAADYNPGDHTVIAGCGFHCLLVDVLAEAEVRQIYGVFGDSLTGITGQRVTRSIAMPENECCRTDMQINSQNGAP
jgi:hypothetical protein